MPYILDAIYLTKNTFDGSYLVSGDISNDVRYKLVVMAERRTRKEAVTVYNKYRKYLGKSYHSIPKDKGVKRK